MSNKKHIIIQGAGIAGLTLAHALLKRNNCTVQVLEKFAHLQPAAGAGITLKQGYHVLKNLQIPELDTIVRATKNLRAETMQGAILGKCHLTERSQKLFHVDAFGYGVLRAELLQLLANALPNGTIQYGTTVQAFEKNNDAGICATLSNGSVIQAHALVGADGIHSQVRSTLFGEEKPTYSGHAMYFGIATQVPEKYYQEDCMTQYFADGKYGVYFPLGKERNTMGYTLAYHSSEVTREAWDQEAAKSKIGMVMGPQISESLATIMEHTSRLLHFGLFYRSVQICKPDMPAVLIGDASHALLPYFGQGANAAIEDALILSYLFEKYNTAQEACNKFEELRKQEVQQVSDMSNESGRQKLQLGTWKRFVGNTVTRVMYKTGLVEKFACKSTHERLVDLQPFVFK